MSLFHLFSRPKVEKSRGHSEGGLNLLSAPRFGKANASKSTLALSVHPPTERSTSRAASVIGFRRSDNRKNNQKMQEPAGPQQQTPLVRRNSWTPPPLFQAYPQATKYGTLEISLSPSETVMSKGRGRKASVQHLATSEGSSRGSMESYDSNRTRNMLRHVATSHSVPVELPRKIFVLVTAGYILQYAETGPSDRLPEKVLQLSSESAAFACDLIPGRHYVLQISQTVDQQGAVVASNGSIFDKLGLKSAAAKRLTSTFLLVMPSAENMLSWMEAIRQEIEALGGKRTEPEAVPTVHRRNAGEFNGLQKAPSQSPRYQIKRDPDRVTTLPSPASPLDAEALHQFPVPPQATPTLQPSPEKPSTSEVEGTSKPDVDASSEEKAVDTRADQPRSRSSSEASTSSSIAQSVEQKQLNSLRNSTSVKRMSYVSAAPTVATSIAESRNSSIRSYRASVAHSPPRPEPKLKQSLDSLKDGSVRSSRIFRRRSNMVLPPAVAIRSPRSSRTNVVGSEEQEEGLTALPSPFPLESPVMGRFSGSYQSLSPSSASRPRSVRDRMSLTSPRSMQCLTEVRAKHDSKIGSPPPVINVDGERPESIVGDLPPPSMWAFRSSPNRRLSHQPQLPPGQAQTHNRVSVQAMPTSAERVPRKRASTPSFSLPLRINPQKASDSPHTTNDQSFSSNDPHHERSKEHTSTPSLAVENIPLRRRSVSPVSPSSIQSSSEAASAPVQNSTARLSLFPTNVSPSIPSRDLLRRSTSNPVSGIMSYQTTTLPLRRPTSIQVRSTNAPFLSSMRPTNSPPTAPGVRTSMTTAPIRSLKPSRSSANMATLSEVSDSLSDLRHPSPNISDRSAGHKKSTSSERSVPDSLGSAAGSPIPNHLIRGFPTPKGLRGLKVRASLPAMDLVSLPPAAPPPSVPLPELPPASRVSSPEPAWGTGLGGSRPPSAAAFSRPPSSAGASRAPASAGLGIQIGS
ncbi:hypothetical protein K431DRAFT_37012 [Polychaeton citri CBS 116435]|uniref:PH domain-containing protein n=1 Tax=Polychaeton citri CBS 116435 TaxID=1314669 RepID=A0A9P4QAS6_9PEZI|nr:hypothetical protein K431DRAFT_37012 [Polychaeton citri CBS 116435]